MPRAIDALIDAQESWAGPLGSAAQDWLTALFARNRPVKDFLNGVWLGHPVHPSVTDVPIGAMTVAVAMDLAGADDAADAAVAVGLLGMLASAPGGAADAVDTSGRSRRFATVHGTLMTASLAAYATSFLLRLGSARRGRFSRQSGGRRGAARLLGWLGYGSMIAGAYVGGDLAYKLGNQVDRHAWRRLPKGWRPLDVQEVPEGRPVRAMLGQEPLVLVREGETIHALHATCSHQGGPLDEGTLVDGCIECPWHQSRFRLSDGTVVQGPAVYDQPALEVRPAAAGGFEARLAQPG